MSGKGRRQTRLDFDVELDGSPFVARFSPDGKSIYNMGNAPRGATPAGIREEDVKPSLRALQPLAAASIPD